MIDKVIETIEKYNMIQSGDGIVVGFSGGPDSVSLLHCLYLLREKYDIKLYAVHLNHMIRGDEALRDENYAREFASRLNIPFYSKRIKVEEYAREKGMSSEEAGRFLRYELFNEVLEENRGNKIALAHNMNDQAETMLMRFFRGSGISGLGGIKPVREGKYIRPIISCSREEILDYCSKNSLNPVMDSTNEESIYTRNRVRLEVIPYIREHFNPNISESLYKASEIFRTEDEFLGKSALCELEKIRRENGIDIEGFKKLHLALKRRIIRSLIEEEKGSLNGIEIKHIDDCISLIERAGTGKNINLPGGLNGIIQYNLFKIEKKRDIISYEYSIDIPGEVTVPELNIIVITRIFDNTNKYYKDSQFIKYFDYDRIKNTLKIRNRRDGDYIYPRGMDGRKKLKDIFIDKKISREERDRIPLITLDSEVLWALRLRDTRNYKADENTKRVLEIRIERGGLNE